MDQQAESRFTAHCLERMRQRKIPPALVLETLERGYRTPTLGGAWYVWGSRVAVILKRGAIITAYWRKKPPKKRRRRK